jgi:hypothetical protein
MFLLHGSTMAEPEAGPNAAIEAAVGRLADGASTHALRGPAARSALAIRTARSLAPVAEAWATVAVEIKHAAAIGPCGLAEEIATGPLATLRLLLVTARALADIGLGMLPTLAAPPRLSHPGSGGPGGAGGPGSRIEVDLLPAFGPGSRSAWLHSGSLHDRAIFGGHRATVRCTNPGGVEVFLRSWREEIRERTREGGVAVVLGAGNVTGLAPADCICQIFEHGRAVLLKLHPLHAPLEGILREGLSPLIEERLLEIVVGGADLARSAIGSDRIGHVHLTGGAAAFEAIRPLVQSSLTCELGNVTPWIVVPGRYSPAQIASQADILAASIINNTSFNCIATKLVVTCRGWDQRNAFLDRLAARLAAAPTRPAWYPGSSAGWSEATGMPEPPDCRLPWTLRRDVDPVREPSWCEREWFVPVAAEIPLDAADVDPFCGAALDLVRRLPGSLAASVTAADDLAPHAAQRVDQLVDHIACGVVGRNCWSALAYAMGNVPWGGFPGGTLDTPRSGIGHVHDPLLLPLVHNSLVRGPLVPSITPAWLPWRRGGTTLARGVVAMYAEIAAGHSGMLPLLRMLPTVLMP